MKKLINILLLLCICFSLKAQLPGSFSWKSRHGYHYLPDNAKDQLIQGPCGVFAAIAAVEAMCQIYYNNPGHSTGLFDFSEAYVYNSGQNGCPGIGCQPAEAASVLNFAKSTGLIDDNAFTFTQNKIGQENCIWDCSSLGTPSQRVFVPNMSNWQIDPANINTVDKLKQAILDYGPVIMVPGPGHRNGCALHPSDQDCDRSHTILLTGWGTDEDEWEIWDSWPDVPSFGLKTYSVFSFGPSFYRVYPVNPQNSNDSIRCVGNQSELFSRKGWDKDGDGFYSWGLESYGRPPGCPGPNLPDWDDNDSTIIFRSGGTIYDTPGISGPGRVCQNEGDRTFELSYVPPGFTSTWYISKNSSCFNTYQGNGSTVDLYPNSSCIGKESEITFRITQNGDGGYAEYKKSFYVNGPLEDMVSMSVLDSYGGSPPGSGDMYYLCPNTTYNIFYYNYDNNCQTSNFVWDLPYGWTKHWDYGHILSINTNDYPYGLLDVKANHCCADIIPVKVYTLYFAEADCGEYFMAYPNPSTEFVDIDVVKDKISSEELISDIKTSLSIVDKSGTVRFSTTFKGFPYRVNTIDLPNGIYFMNIQFKDKRSSIRLVIKH